MRALVDRKRVSGFSLVELLISMTIGVSLLAGLAAIFGNSSLSGSELEKSVRQMENGRYATDVLTQDVSLAGYYGELPIDALSTVQVDPCATSISALGWNNVTPTVPVRTTGLSSSEASVLSCLPNRKNNTPALVLRRLDTVPISPAEIAADTLYVQSSRCKLDPTPANPLSKDYFVASSSINAFVLREINCTALTGVRRYVNRIYFIASCDECGLDTIPTLKRAELIGGQIVVSPLAQGVDDIAFEYGFDTTPDGDGLPDVYRTGLSGTAMAKDNDWNNVVAIRFYILVRTTERSAGFVDGKTYSLGLAGTRGPYTDGFKRRLFITTARLNNPSNIKEKPL